MSYSLKVCFKKTIDILFERWPELKLETISSTIASDLAKLPNEAHERERREKSSKSKVKNNLTIDRQVTRTPTKGGASERNIQVSIKTKSSGKQKAKQKEDPLDAYYQHYSDLVIKAHQGHRALGRSESAPYFRRGDSGSTKDRSQSREKDHASLKRSYSHSHSSRDHRSPRSGYERSRECSRERSRERSSERSRLPHIKDRLGYRVYERGYEERESRSSRDLKRPRETLGRSYKSDYDELYKSYQTFSVDMTPRERDEGTAAVPFKKDLSEVTTSGLSESALEELKDSQKILTRAIGQK